MDNVCQGGRALVFPLWNTPWRFVWSIYLSGQHTGVFRAVPALEKASGQTREDGTWEGEPFSAAALLALVGKCKSTHFRFCGQLQIKGSWGKETPSVCLSFPIALFPDTTCRVSCRGWGVSCAWDVQAIREPCIAMRKLGEEAKGPGRLV